VCALPLPNLKISRKEWEVIKAIPSSQNLMSLVRETNLPYSTIRYVLGKIRKKASIHFIPDFWSMRLIPITTVHKKSLEFNTAYTFLTSKQVAYSDQAYVIMTNLVPYSLIEDFVKSIRPAPLIEVRGLGSEFWTPNNFLEYDPVSKSLKCSLSGLFNMKHDSRFKVDKRVRKYDWIDLVIILMKVNYAYTKMSEIRETLREWGVNISEQLLCYHERNHVRDLWRYNAVFFGTHKDPGLLLVLKGGDSEEVARKLVKIPLFNLCLIDHENGTALLRGYHTLKLNDLLRTVHERYDVEIFKGPLFVEKPRATYSISIDSDILSNITNTDITSVEKMPKETWENTNVKILF